MNKNMQTQNVNLKNKKRERKPGVGGANELKTDSESNLLLGSFERVRIGNVLAV